jgi:hypothetical protein
VKARGLSDDLTWALRLVRMGADRRKVIEAISHKHAKHGYHSLIYFEHLKSRGTAAAERYAEKTADRAIAIAKEAPRVTNPYEARERLSELYAYVDAEPWPVNLAGARRALEAAYVIGYERGRVAEMKLDLRTHALAAGQSFKAIRVHRKQLHELGWLRRHSGDRGRGISRLSFHLPPRAHRRPLGGHPMCPPPLTDPVLAHDAWRPGAFGDAGWLVQAQIMNRAPLPARGTWDDVIGLLQEHGLGIPLASEDLIRALDLAALTFGTFNSGYRDWETFAAERARRAAASKRTVAVA